MGVIRHLVACAQGKPIVDPLPVGPNPQAQVPLADDQLPLDAEMQWMIDFDAAESVGMALRIPMTGRLVATRGHQPADCAGGESNARQQRFPGALADHVAGASIHRRSPHPGRRALLPTIHSDIAAGFSSASIPGTSTAIKRLFSNPIHPARILKPMATCCAWHWGLRTIPLSA